MRINNIELKNFRCFRDLEIDFGKITLLTGANSSGKSSLISSILSIFQTEFFPFFLSTNGNYTELGGFEDVVFNHDTTKDITISVKFENHFQNENDDILLFTPFEVLSTWELNKINGLPILKTLTLKAEFASDFYIEIKKEDLFYLTISKTKDISSYIFNNWHKFITELKNVENIKNSEKSDFNENSFYVSKIPFQSIDEMYNKVFFNSKSEVLKTYAEDINNIFKTVNKSFNYIHSYRIAPQRVYNQVSKAQNKVNPNGQGYIDQIVEWKETNLEKWNSLISTLSNLKILEDITVNRLKGGMNELKVKVHKNGLFNSFSDVGFGVSKLLPIIVADLQLNNTSLLAISEPEIDLHPSVQADFADYLSKQVINYNKQYIIETHSEYLLNRIRLLIAKGELLDEDVKIYFLDHDGEKSECHKIELKKNGEIVGAPDNFFKTYLIDTMQLTMSTFDFE
jgi:predicted ATPase